MGQGHGSRPKGSVDQGYPWNLFARSNVEVQDMVHRRGHLRYRRYRRSSWMELSAADNGVDMIEILREDTRCRVIVD